MRRKLMITLLTITMATSLFVGCGNSDTSETVETTVVEETEVAEKPEVETVDEPEEETITEEPETTDTSETVAKPKASTHYKEWKEKQEDAEVEEEPEVAEKKEETKTNTKKETEKKETTTTASATTNTNTSTPEPAPTPEPTPSNNNTTTPVAETPSEPAAPAPAAPSNPTTCSHTFTTTRVGGSGNAIPVGTGQYEQVQVDSIPGEPIYDTNPDSPTFGNCIGFTPETPVYETREITTMKMQKTDYYEDRCTKCGYTTTRTETHIE